MRRTLLRMAHEDSQFRKRMIRKLSSKEIFVTTGGMGMRYSPFRETLRLLRRIFELREVGVEYPSKDLDFHAVDLKHLQSIQEITDLQNLLEEDSYLNEDFKDLLYYVDFKLDLVIKSFKKRFLITPQMLKDLQYNLRIIQKLSPHLPRKEN